LERNRFADQLASPLVVALLVGHEAKEMERIGVPGLLGKDGSVHLRGFIKSTIDVMFGSD